MAKKVTLKDKDDVVLYPQTVVGSVYDANGTALDGFAIVDNLVTNSTEKSLSAARGKALNDKIKDAELDAVGETLTDLALGAYDATNGIIVDSDNTAYEFRSKEKVSSLLATIGYKYRVFGTNSPSITTNMSWITSGWVTEETSLSAVAYSYILVLAMKSDEGDLAESELGGIIKYKYGGSVVASVEEVNSSVDGIRDDLFSKVGVEKTLTSTFDYSSNTAAVFNLSAAFSESLSSEVMITTEKTGLTEIRFYEGWTQLAAYPISHVGAYEMVIPASTNKIIVDTSVSGEGTEAITLSYKPITSISAKQDKLAETVEESFQALSTEKMGDTFAESLDIGCIPNICGYPMILRKTENPSSAPDFVGQIYINTVARNVYIAVGVNSVSDYIKIN